MRTDRLSTGSPDLDEMLGGGLERRVITQIYGEPASGKSTICIMAAVACLKAGYSVIFIDTEGFSIERFAQVAGEDAESLARHLFISEPADFEHQGTMIAESEEILKMQTDREVGLFIMDSATALYRTELDTGKDALRRLSHHMVKILGLAKKYDIPALVTNQVFVDLGRNTFAGLGGTSLEHISKVIVRVEKRDGYRRAVLEKHRSRPEGIAFDFEITETGMKRI